MGESDDSMFESYEVDDGSEVTESNQCFNEDAVNDEESGFKRIRLSTEERDADISPQSSPLGLTLSKTPSFLNLLQKRLSKGKQPECSSQDMPRTKKDDLGSQSTSEKLKASNFTAIFIKIGTWQRISRYEGDLVAKLYYAKRKLVWEILEGALKSKIEIQWSDIAAIRAVTPRNEPGTLEIELNRPPLFYRESNPQPRKHTLWQQASDFTGGQAPIWRGHYVRFPAGILDKHYEKLLQCDQRLSALSRRPFPSSGSPYFDSTMIGISELSLSFAGFGSQYQHPYSYPTYPTPLKIFPNSVMDLPCGNGGRNNLFASQEEATWRDVDNQWSSHITSVPCNQRLQSQTYHPNVGLLNNMGNFRLRESPGLYSSEAVQESTDVNPGYDASDYTITDQVMQSGRDPILDGVNWFSPQDSGDNIAVEQTVNISIPPFPVNPSNVDFFNL